MMRYAFFGSPEFAAGVLRAISHPPALVVTNPDRPAGRKKVITPPLAKALAIERGIPVIQPERIQDALGALSGFDFFVVAAYAQIIPRTILDLAPRGTIGVHPSLLPRYRGASPIQSAILNRDTETGTTLYLLDHKMDHGPILAQEAVPIGPEETYSELESRLASLGARMLSHIISRLGTEAPSGIPQDESLATYTVKFATQDAFIEPADLRAAEGGDPVLAPLIHAKIRAFEREPVAWTMQVGKRVKLLQGKLANGRLRVARIQVEGKGPSDI